MSTMSLLLQTAKVDCGWMQGFPAKDAATLRTEPLHNHVDVSRPGYLR